MQVKDVMTPNVIFVYPDETTLKAMTLMLENHISGLPVLDKEGELIGVVTEGDFLRRGELNTERRRSRLLEFILGPGRLADEYVHTAGRKIEEVMTPDPVTVKENDSLRDVVDLMERRHVKRLPVLRAGRLVGIVSRANLMHALVSLSRESEASTRPGGAASADWAIRADILAALGKENWAPNIDIVVRNGVVEIWGAILDDRQRRAIMVAIENVAGVKKVHDHLVWVEPASGMAFPSAEDEVKEHPATI